MIGQMISLFTFGLVVTFIVFLGVLRAKEYAERELRSQQTARSEAPEESIVRPGVLNPDLRPSGS